MPQNSSAAINSEVLQLIREDNSFVAYLDTDPSLNIHRTQSGEVGECTLS